MNKRNDEPVILFNLSLFGGSMTQLLTILTGRLLSDTREGGKTFTVVTPNPEQVMVARNNPAFLRSLQAADLQLPDGSGLVHASKLFKWRYGSTALHEPLPGRLVAARLLHWAHEHVLTVLVIGGRELGLGKSANSVQLLRPILRKDWSKLESTSWFWTEGYDQIHKPSLEEEVILEKNLIELQPDLVFIAFGAPHQELWLSNHRDLLSSSNVKVAMTVGGSFDVLTGHLKPVPAWMEHLNLEWAYRLWQEPWRWRRQRSILRFVGWVFVCLCLPGRYRAVSHASPSSLS